MDDGVCDLENQCPNFIDDIDLDDDGILFCQDDCIAIIKMEFVMKMKTM